MQNIADLKSEKQDILAQRNIRTIDPATGQLIDIADPRKLKDINEQIAKAQSDFEEIQREQSFNAKERLLEDDIELFEKQKDAEEESWDDRIELAEDAIDELNEAVSDGGKITEELYDGIFTALSNIQADGLGGMLNDVKQYVADYNSELSRIASLENQISTGSTSTPNISTTTTSAPNFSSADLLSDRRALVSASIAGAQEGGGTVIEVDNMTVEANNIDEFISKIEAIAKK